MNKELDVHYDAVLVFLSPVCTSPSLYHLRLTQVRAIIAMMSIREIRTMIKVNEANVGEKYPHVAM